jgi:hypothetical protein
MRFAVTLTNMVSRDAGRFCRERGIQLGTDAMGEFIALFTDETDAKKAEQQLTEQPVGGQHGQAKDRPPG